MGDDVDDEVSRTMSEDDDVEVAIAPRIWQFPRSHNGPYSVSIRELTFKLFPIKFSVYLNKTYKSITAINQFPKKMTVILSDRVEANALMQDEIFGNYRVYLPAAEVEIDGVVNSLDNLLIHGVDKFGNPEIPPVAILAEKRLSKNITVDTKKRILTDGVKITFEGNVLLRRFVRSIKKPWSVRNVCSSDTQTSTAIENLNVLDANSTTKQKNARYASLPILLADSWAKCRKLPPL